MVLYHIVQGHIGGTDKANVYRLHRSIGANPGYLLCSAGLSSSLL